MKKIFLFLLLTIGIISLSFGSIYASGCTGGDIKGGEVGDNLEKCLGDMDFLGQGSGGTGEVVMMIRDWALTISIYLYVLAAFGIAYGSFLLTTSRGEADKAKTAKNAILGSIFGFICVITAYFVVNLVIGIMYSI